MDSVLGLDVSRWQGKITWDQVAQAGYRFAFVRATIGDYYTDQQFEHNWDGARGAGLLVSAYHVIAPKVPPATQVAHFLQILNGRIPDLPLVLDVERSDGVSRDGIAACAIACLEALEVETGRRPIIYTARWFWDRWMPHDAEWGAYHLWIASYTEAPLIPGAWADWHFWQYSERGKVPGVSSRAVDLNRFNGSYDDLVRYVGQGDDRGTDEAPDQKTEPDGSEEEPGRLLWPRMRVVDGRLNIRSGPGTKFDDLGDLHLGDVLEIYDIAGDDVWVQLEPGKWAAFSHKGERYMVLAPYEEPEEDASSPEEGKEEETSP